MGAGVTVAIVLRLSGSLWTRTSSWEGLDCFEAVESMLARSNCLILELMVEREMVNCCASQMRSLMSVEQGKSIQSWYVYFIFFFKSSVTKYSYGAVILIFVFV